MRFLYIISLLLVFAAKAQAAGVAVIAPKDGDEARFGRQMSEGVKIAVEVINESGGLLGEKLELLDMDDACSESASQGNLQRLRLGADSGVNLVVGPYCIDEPLQNLSKDTHAVWIIPQPLTNSRYNYDRVGLFKIGGRVSEQAKTVLEVYKDRWIDKNMAVVYDAADDAAYETAAEVQNIFAANELANRITLYDMKSYDGKLKKMAKEIVRNNKVAYVLGKKSQIAEIAQKLQEKDENITLIIDEYNATDFFFKEMGNFVDGVYFLRVNDQKSNANFTKDLVELRIKKREPRGLGLIGYAAVMMWRDMVEEAESFEAGTIEKISTLKSWSLPWGKTKFQHGRALLTGGWNMYLMEDGEYTQVN